ncbi:hypothetical protein FDECE_16058 [Fusarium decemcellulare]|nr:hypothetical protein FDECE_16058 [Fusarium decemcellulare]
MDVTRVGFVGLGAMGLGMACNLMKNPEYRVCGYDVFLPSVTSFAAKGGRVADSPREAAKDSTFLVIMAANVEQVDKIIFDIDTGVLQSILICSTISPTYYDNLTSRLTHVGRDDILVVDCPVSGGAQRAAQGTLTIFASGSLKALHHSQQLLRCMSEKLHIIDGGEGVASKIKMVNQLLVGVHISVAAEAMGLAAKAELNTQEVYNIITNAAGNSWAFENRVPHMLNAEWTPLSALNIFVKDMGIVVSAARSLRFPVPLASTAEQLFIAGSAQGYGADDDAGLVRVFLPRCPDKVREQASQSSQKPDFIQEIPMPVASKIGVVGLGAMGQGMATSLVRAGFKVHGYDVSEPAIQKFVSTGDNAFRAASPTHAAKEANMLIIMVQNAGQAEDVLLGSGQAAHALPENSVVMLCSTVPPSFVRDLQSKLDGLCRGIQLIDAPVSGGVARAASGNLTIIYSGDESVLSHATTPLLAMAGSSENLHRVQGHVGAASSVKMINQLLAGCHIAAAAEAMAFSARLGLNTKQVFEFVGNAAAWSWMLENRTPQMLDADWTPHSALDIFVKDLGIVLGAAKRFSYFAPMSSAAHTLYLTAAARGWSKEADAGIVRLWELNGVSVASKAIDVVSPEGEDSPSISRLKADETINMLPPEYAGDALGSIASIINRGAVPTLVVLDDDPTGTQTCHDIDVLTVWNIETIRDQFNRGDRGFFILTNSRALPPQDAKKLISEICQNVKVAAEQMQRPFEIVLRGDSTLRGHLPEEPEAVEETLGRCDGWIIAPFFFQGGRYTIDDVHYIKEANELVPVNQTPFAQDATFGYRNANLRRYVMEKCGRRFSESSFVSVTIEDIRLLGPVGVAEKLLSAGAASDKVFIVNAAAESDMHVFVAGLLEAEQRGRRYLYRTGAAFVSSRLGIKGIPPLTFHDLKLPVEPSGTFQLAGGLIIAGSYVPKTTAQLKLLREKRGERLVTIELDVAELIINPQEADSTVREAANTASTEIARGHDVLIMTSRKLIQGQDALTSLQIGGQVAMSLVEILSQIESRPRYVIAKGGITSSDAASKGLRMKRARVIGQAAPGVPLWRCDEETSRHRGVPYLVFPGNVGTDDTLYEIVKGWSMHVD